MRIFKNEEIIFKTENERIILTNIRLREERDSIFGKSIKSILLEKITSCEMRTIKNIKYLKWAIFSFLYLNGLVYLFNNFLTIAEISKFFFGPNKIPTNAAITILYISLGLSTVFLWFFFASIKKVASFHSTGTVIDIQLKMLDDDIRETLIGKIEETKNKRIGELLGRKEMD